LFKKIINYICSISLILFILLATILACCFDKSFYEIYYQQNNLAAEIGMRETDLLSLKDDLLDYLLNKRSDLEVSYEVDDELRLIFDEREKTHMVDVKALCDKALLVMVISFIIFILCLIYIIYKKEYYLFFRSYKRVLLYFILFILFLFLYAALDFNKFWSLFHNLIFDNDLWLLNPNTEILVQMVPEGFFYTLVIKIILLIIIFNIAAYILIKHWGNKNESYRLV